MTLGLRLHEVKNEVSIDVFVASGRLDGRAFVPNGTRLGVRYIGDWDAGPVGRVANNGAAEVCPSRPAWRGCTCGWPVAFGDGIEVAHDLRGYSGRLASGSAPVKRDCSIRRESPENGVLLAWRNSNEETANQREVGMSDGERLWIPALTGGLMGAFLNQIFQMFSEWFQRPVLKAEFSSLIEGCEVDNVKLVDGTKGKYLRIKVSNNGRTTALDVQVIIAKVSSEGQNGWASSGEILDALWSHWPEGSGPRLDIPSKTPRFADLCAIPKLEGNVELRICTKLLPAQLQDRELKGTLVFQVYVAARNAKTICKIFKIRFDGTATSLKII